jgi:hypothetical protein
MLTAYAHETEIFNVQNSLRENPIRFVEHLQTLVGVEGYD